MEVIWDCGQKRWVLDQPLIMGVLNVTPDSFSDGFNEIDRALVHADQLVRDGADILDIGGESTRPGSQGISLQQEMDRVLPVIESLRARCEIPLSIDTQKPALARAAVAAGASIINHVSGTLDLDSMLPLLQSCDAGYVLMHMPRRPKAMQTDPQYDEVIADVGQALAVGMKQLIEAGISTDRVLLDPGIGFGKTLQHNLLLMGRLDDLVTRGGRPLLMGVSRKSWLVHLLGEMDWDDRDACTAITSALFPFPSAAVHRVHNVALVRNALAIRRAIQDPMALA